MSQCATWPAIQQIVSVTSVDPTDAPKRVLLNHFADELAKPKSAALAKTTAYAGGKEVRGEK
jgi:hypothetical protein